MEEYYKQLWINKLNNIEKNGQFFKKKLRITKIKEVKWTNSWKTTNYKIAQEEIE